MDFLKPYGIGSGEDLQHAHMAKVEDFPHAEYKQRAESFLSEVAEPVSKNIKHILNTIPGKWNPGGFIVFPLGLLSDNCSLRLHIWPAGMERETDQGPNPHDHALHLSSKVLSGTFKDEILAVNTIENPSNERLQDQGVYGLYSTYRGKNGRDSLVTDGTQVSIDTIESRQIKEGDVHHIPFGDYHLSDIPKDELVATLVLDSPSFKKSSNVLLKSCEQEILRIRRSVEAVQTGIAIQQLTDYLSNK
jgi:hypothetical protein